MSSGIYKWTSITNKSYIGQSVNLEKRYKEFKKPNSTYTTKNSKIDNARAKQVITQESIDKAKETMRIKRQNGWVNKGQIEANSKKVGQYSLDDKLIEIHSSLRNAAKAMNKKDSKLIRKVCQGKRNDAYGYVWKFI